MTTIEWIFIVVGVVIIVNYLEKIFKGRDDEIESLENRVSDLEERIGINEEDDDNEDYPV